MRNVRVHFAPNPRRSSLRWFGLLVALVFLFLLGGLIPSEYREAGSRSIPFEPSTPIGRAGCATLYIDC